MKYGSGGWLGSSAMVCALRAVAMLLRAGRLGVGSPMISVPLCEITTSLFLLGGGRTVKKRGGRPGQCLYIVVGGVYGVLSLSWPCL